jgi:hypothetical protein
MARPGRESKFTEECRTRILEHIEAGNTLAVSARRSGICPRTLTYWMARGRKATDDADPFAAFLAGIKKARAGAEDSAVRGLLAIGHGGIVIERTTRTDRDGNPVVTEKYSRPEWTALAWWLERMSAKDWAKDNDIIRRLVADLRKREAADVEALAPGVPGG